LTPRPLLRVGLTGGVATGKSTVARIWRELGAELLDADVMVHALFEPGGAVTAAIAARLGASMLDAAGRVDRAVLGPRIFADPEARRELEAIVHPALREAIARRIAELVAQPGPPLVVVDAALLVESGMHAEFDRLVVVDCDEATQRRRLAARDGLTPEQVEARLSAQTFRQRRLELADYVIDTGGSLERTREQATAVHARLLAEHRATLGPGFRPEA
jgi:dephospho-CoA kinase